MPSPQVIYYGAGEQPKNCVPGDFILTHARGWVGSFIRFGQRLRFRGGNKKYAYWSHAALVVSTNGDLVEALGGGVSKSNLSKYKDTEYHYIKIMPQFISRDRNQVCAFAEWSFNQHTKYGFLTILSIAFKLLTGFKFSFFLDGTEICSGLAARALERTDAIFPDDPVTMSPAHLAAFYNVVK